MNYRRSGDQRVGDVGGFKCFVGAAIGQEAAFAAWIDERNQPAGRPFGVADEMRRHARCLEPRRLARDIGEADTRDEIGPYPEGR